MGLLIIYPHQAEHAYDEAVRAFCGMYENVTGTCPVVSDVDDLKSDLVIIGSDAVNDFLMNEMFEQRVRSLRIRYGTDDYCIRSYTRDDRKILILAGGRVRSTIYAIYDYFERYANCHYFWDGDVIPHMDEIPMENIDLGESPRFEYRGLRYFAHRGLKRFQAEHWSFADWKQEIDWMLKKRLNFFMMRIGMDDVWQRAFPEDVPYPDGFRTIEGADANGYDDRSDFWTLKYRGKLREEILAYARSVDLTYPTDCGTMTHWYSRTPQEFLDKRKPAFLEQADHQYCDTSTGKVWDFRIKENIDNYMHLTETMVEEYEKNTGLFHSIGLGERRMYEDKAKNFQLKLFAYRRITENIRKRYPNAKLMLAAWDFIGWWTGEEVQNLIAELDPERTLILDYTSEVNDPKQGFQNWGVVGKFPWIFGLFHAYESESELRGPYERSDARLKIAAEDPFCKGMVLWPELSHSDPLILEYLSNNAWAPLRMTIEEMTARFCRNRYGVFADHMNTCWQTILPFIKQKDWGGYSRRKPGDDKYMEYCNSWFVHQDLWTKLSDSIHACCHDANLINHYQYLLLLAKPLMKDIVAVLRLLSSNPEALKLPFIFRDAIDITRTVLSRFMNFLITQAVPAIGDPARIEVLKEQYLKLMDILGKLLALNPDFSIYQTLLSLQAAAPTNPNYEITLKRNIYNVYCTQAAYELVTQIFCHEGKLIFDWMKNGNTSAVPDFHATMAPITEHFFGTPLEEMQPTDLIPLEEVIAKAADAVEEFGNLLC